jgi:hypothetical protein
MATRISNIPVGTLAAPRPLPSNVVPRQATREDLRRRMTSYTNGIALSESNPDGSMAGLGGLGELVQVVT